MITPLPPAIRPAASLLLIRDARTSLSGVEIVAIRRAESMRFLPGFLAFPGGAVDKFDADRSRSTDNLHILARYSEDDEVFAATALRECYEEIGVHIAVPTLRFVGRWVTPPNPHARFDTLFFAVDANSVGESFTINRDELVWARWWNAAELYEAIQLNRMQAVPPTRAMLAALANMPDVATAMCSLTVPGPVPQP